MTVVARYAIQDKYSQLIKQGKAPHLRSLYFKDIAEGNHFIHSDLPETFMKGLEYCIRQN